MKWWNGDIKGTSALSKQQNLLQQCLAGWPRRGKTLLEINCGQGAFSPLLWECGFDLTVTELRPEQRTQAAAVLGARAEILAAADDYLPFEDNFFDCAVLHLAAGDTKKIDAAVHEALRVSSRGIAVPFGTACLWRTLCTAFRAANRPGPARPIAGGRFGASSEAPTWGNSAA